jgi:hypothetical protein
MANRTIKVYGHNHAADTALTVSWGGAEVYNGTLSASVVDFDDIIDTTAEEKHDQEELFEFTYNNADDSATTTHSLSITVSAGSASIGTIRDSAGGGTTEYDSYPGVGEMTRNGAPWEGVSGKPPVDLIDGTYYWQQEVYHADASTLNEDQTNMTINTTAHAINGASVAVPESAPSGYAWSGFTFYLVQDDVYTNTTSVYEAMVTNAFPGKGYGQTKYS